ncbi:hypothetical protein R5R35_005325 [Gryllus longicercus]|uniref:CNH domain-containing protein n=1 Tax=Gryllus longicercus TaxID=2509291 RepID=A0AAN9Z528_9ORTH
MHDAYDLVQLLKLTVQIESIAAYEDNLLVGTKQGHLLMYSVCYREADTKHEVQLLRYNKNFSKKPIQQLAVVPEYQLLISLSDNIICVHDISIINFPAVNVVQKSRGATLFALDIKKYTSLTGETSVTVRLCVAVKRKLQLYYWKNGSFLELSEDLAVPDVPRALVWCQETLCVGFKGEYSLVHLSPAKKQDLFPTGKHQEPLITKLSDSTYALGKDMQSIFMNTDGNPIQKYAVKWSEVPVVVAYDEPYLIALLSETVEIRTIEPCLFIQSINSASKARLATQAPPDGRLYIASSSHVWLVRAMPVERQVRTLLRERQFQLALRLTEASPGATDDERKRSLKEIQRLYALDLFQNKLFHEAMQEFLKLEIDPYEVIRLFPDLLPQTSRPGPEPNPPPDTRMKLQDRELENGLLALIEFLTEVRCKLMRDVKNRNHTNTNSPNRVVNNNNNLGLASNGESVNVTDNGSGSNRVRDRSTQQLLQIIDTTLLKCYLQTNDALVAPLLRLNHCHLQETEKTLRRHQKYSELIILYQTKGLHRKALELLQKQADQPDSPLFGHERTLNYLQHLGKDNIKLIFDFSGWVLERHPEEGLKIFTEDVMEVEQLPRPQVLDFLLRQHKHLVIPYLEHVIHVWEDQNLIFHNALVHQYRERVQELLAAPAEGEERSPSQDEEAKQLRAKLLTFLERSTHYIPETVIIHFPLDCLFEERAVVVGKLGHHEKALSIYVSILGDVPRAIQYCDKVYEQKAEGYEDVYVLLMRMLICPPENWLIGAPPPVTVQPDLETALSLLEQYASRIPPVKALGVLPDKVPLGRIQHFLETCVQRQLSERRRTQVLKGLVYAEHLQVQEQRVHFESQSILVTEFNVCSVCKKRFGNQSAFARYPNGDIVHYSCQDRRA